MKNNLKTVLGALAATSALTAAGPAVAAEKISLSLEGYMEQWLGFADQDSDWETANGTNYRSFDQQSDTEVHFVGQTKLDNGIVVSVHIELEGDESVGEIDESWLELESAFGTARIGGVPNVLEEMHVGSPDVGIGNQDGDYMNWVLTPANFVDNSATYFGVGKTNKVSYYTPNFAGFTLGASYVPDAANSSGFPDDKNGAQKAYSFGGTYENQFGDFGVYVDLGFGKTFRTPTTTGQHVYQVGVNLSYMGFTLGGSYADINEKNFAATTSAKGNAYDLGLSYGAGPYAVSLTWFHSEAEGDVSVAGDDEKDSIMLSGSYNLGPGVDVAGSVFFVEYDDETTTAANNNEGYGGVAGLVLSF